MIDKKNGADALEGTIRVGNWKLITQDTGKFNGWSPSYDDGRGPPPAPAGKSPCSSKSWCLFDLEQVGGCVACLVSLACASLGASVNPVPIVAGRTQRSAITGLQTSLQQRSSCMRGCNRHRRPWAGKICATNTTTARTAARQPAAQAIGSRSSTTTGTETQCISGAR